MWRLRLSIALSVALAGVTLVAETPVVGPVNGALLMVGGGRLGPDIVGRFIELAGGPNAPIVVVPTAGDREKYDDAWSGLDFLRKAGARRLAVLHTRDRRVADSDAFVRPLAAARGVWLTGGRHWRLIDAYLHTRTHRELVAVLQRGGVIGGTSAGATIQGSYTVRGARESNAIMIAPGYEEGFGLLRGVTVDQHLLARNRQDDLVPVIEKHPELLGLGIDENTAIVVRGDRFEVIGGSKVGVYDGRVHDGGRKYYFLSAGDAFNLRTRALEAANVGSGRRQEM